MPKSAKAARFPVKNVRQTLQTVRTALRTVVSNVPAAVTHLTGRPLPDKERIRRIGTGLLAALAAFFLANAALPDQIHPFGIALLCAASSPDHALAAAAGLFLASPFYGAATLTYALLAALLYLLRRTFTAARFDESLRLRVVECAAANAVAGTARIVSRSEEPFHAYIAFLACLLFSVIACLAFTVILDGKTARRTPAVLQHAAAFAVLAACTAAFRGFALAGIDLSLAFAALASLVTAAESGFVYASVAGFACALACSSAQFGPALGLAAFAAGLVMTARLGASLAAFGLAFFACGAYTAGLFPTLRALPSVTLAVLLFFPACAFLPDALRLSKTASPRRKDPPPADDRTRKDLVKAFFTVSDVFDKLARADRRPTRTDVAYVLDKAFGETCAACALGEMCYAKRHTDRKALVGTLEPLLFSRDVTIDDFGKDMREKCIRPDALCEAVGRYYRDTVDRRLSDDRTALLASSFASQARLLENVGELETERAARDTAFENRLAAALRKAGIAFSAVTVTDNRAKHASVTGVDPAKIPYSGTSLARFISAECGVRITPPCFGVGENAGTLTFERDAVLSFEYAHKSGRKQGEEINGDTVRFFRTDGRYFYALLCDGMGSGPEAAAASRLAALFLETVLATGMKKALALEMLGETLLARGGECFSTVDLLEADLLTGACTFLKAGAAPTYILRGDRLFKIESVTPPVGVLPSFTAESTRFDLEKGDLVLFVSDGVTQGDDDPAFFAEVAKTVDRRDPVAAAEAVYGKVLGRGALTDDTTVSALVVGDASSRASGALRTAS